MSTTDAIATLARYERRVCRRWNRVRSSTLLGVLRLVSRAGDGAFWVLLSLSLPLVYGRGQWPVVAQVGVCFALCYPVYRVVKGWLARPRPCVAEAGVGAWLPPLDQYAFPSGHTMHAAALSIVLGVAHPDLLWLLVPFSGAVAISRVVLGLHYPSDVLAGGLLGALVGVVVINLGF
jgi:undecaprenyl-diphosphatase